MYNAKRCEKKFFEHLEKSNADIKISALSKIQHNFKELEEQLFNCRITKFIKLDPSINIREFRTKVNITETLSQKLHAHCLDVAVKTKTITNYSNLSKEERDALHNLSHDDSIIIKPADKGSGIVVWVRSYFLLGCQRELSEQQVYEKIEQSPLEKVTNKIKTTLKQMVLKKEIETKVMEYLLVKRPQLGRFYLLPKIHKHKTNVPGRPVISNNQTATENISSFLDSHLKDIVPTIPHILEDTKDFLKRINDIGEIPSGSLLVTFDVVGLYPHIPHEERIETIKKYLNLRKDQSVSTNSLCDLARIV